MTTIAGSHALLLAPERGLELRHAITWFAVNVELARRYQALALRALVKRGTPGSLDDAEHGELDSYRVGLCQDLVGRLGDGELVARGRVAGTLAMQEVPADFWRGVRLDLAANTAEVPGTLLTGILVAEPQPAPAAGVGEAAEPPSGPSRPAKRKGGAPPGYDWPAFRRELSRAIYEGDCTTKRAAGKHMRAWIARTWRDQPDDRTIRRNLADVLPATMPDT